MAQTKKDSKSASWHRHLKRRFKKKMDDAKQKRSKYGS